MEVRPPRQIDRKIPRELERICLRALSKRVTDRYNSAGDMAEEIELWEEAATQKPQPIAPTGSSDSAPQSASPSQNEAAVIPRGLRAYESGDADFFLRLLPGPTDRDGLPESVRFWKAKIEETEPGQSFGVGVILGPSGSGKSSLVRAGIIPHLNDDVIPVWADTRVANMERQLLKRIKKRVPTLQGARSLHDALVAVRRSRALQSGSKLLLVFDQFEQWLNHHRAEASSELADALRQCNGTRLQTLLLIRDDFTLDAANFMDQIEEPLSQTRNFAAVDLFGKEHARKVLLAFGRAYGAISETVPREQERFLSAVVEGLAESSRIYPIQLALFADMVKDKPWTMPTLREYGGMRGIGVAFLDEKLTGASAHPFLRSQSELTAKLLGLLLPDEDAVIKGTAKTRAELIQHFSPIARPDSLDRVLGLLDSELRLITPSGGDSSQSAESVSANREPAYQLTHDYLVPTIRSWLTASERATRPGRVRLRLNELSESWNAKPESRRLPTVWEWLSIRFWTQTKDWTPPHRKMMRTAETRIGVRSGVVISLSIVLCMVGYDWNGRTQAVLLRDRLLNEDTMAVGEIVALMKPKWRWVSPLLQDKWAAMANESPPDDAEGKAQILRQKLHVALALSSDDAEFASRAMDDLQSLAPEELTVVASFFPSLEASRLDPLWATVANPSASSRQRLAAAAVLAATQPENKRWITASPKVTEDLSQLRPFQLVDWAEQFKPIREHILPQTLAILKQDGSLPAVSGQRVDNAIELTSIYAED